MRDRHNRVPGDNGDAVWVVPSVDYVPHAGPEVPSLFDRDPAELAALFHRVRESFEADARRTPEECAAIVRGAQIVIDSLSPPAEG